MLAGYLMAAGRFELAFVAAGVIGLGVPFVVAQWRRSLRGHIERRRQEFRRGIPEVGA